MLSFSKISRDQTGFRHAVLMILNDICVSRYLPLTCISREKGKLSLYQTTKSFLYRLHCVR